MSTYSSSPPITPPSSDSEDDESCNLSPLPNGHPQFSNRFPSPHPFAASTKADQKPPSYSKRYSPTSVSPSEKGIFPLVSPRIIQSTSRNNSQTEQSTWEAVIASVIDRAESKIDLSFLNLTYIPPFISDLKNLVVLPRRELFASDIERPERILKKSSTTPTLGSFLKRPSPDSTLLPPTDITEVPKRRLFERADTLARFIPSPILHFSSVHGNGLELYLMSNCIATLPRELFELDRLVVLSLRGNSLTTLPSAIRSLRALRELNIANNRISFLPAEMQELRLQSLQLHPNPYLRPPDMLVNTVGKRLLGPLRGGPIVPSLQELALRCLLTPDEQSTKIEAALSIADIDALPVPGHIQSVLRASTGHMHSRARPSQTDVNTDLDMRLNNCPSPHHRQVFKSLENPRTRGVHFQVESRDFVFNIPTEVRMEWVGEVAGVIVANTLKAFVPIEWRGCGYGCLNFLEGENSPKKPDSMFQKMFGSALGENGDEFEFSDVE